MLIKIIFVAIIIFLTTNILKTLVKTKEFDQVNKKKKTDDDIIDAEYRVVDDK